MAENEKSVALIIDVPGYKGQERRKTERDWRIEVEGRLSDGQSVMKRTEEKVDENTKITKELAASIGEMVALFNNAKGAFKLLESIGKVVKPLTAIAFFIGAVWALISSIKNGTPPAPPAA